MTNKFIKGYLTVGGTNQKGTNQTTVIPTFNRKDFVKKQA
jgi:hypothetical protein